MEELRKEIEALALEADNLHQKITEKTNLYNASRSHSCTVCNEEKPSDNFYFYKKQNKDIYFNKCKKCSNKFEKKGSKYSNISEEVKEKVRKDLIEMKSKKEVAEANGFNINTFYYLLKNNKFDALNISENGEDRSIISSVEEGKSTIEKESDSS